MFTLIRKCDGLNSQGMQSLGFTLCFYFAVLLGTSGCTSTWKHVKNKDFKRAVGMKSDKPLPPEIPVRIVSTWTDTVLQRAGKTPQRGFGGRLLFFTRESEDPVRVDGQLVVYAFDETDRKPHETHPTRKYVFPAEEFARRESASKLGPSYSVWLPWDEVGGNVKQISLIARFEPDGGTYVMGEQTKHMLPGISKADPEQLVEPGGVGPVKIAQHSERPVVENDVKQISAEEPIAESKVANKNDGEISTTTIALPKKWQERLKQSTR
jgi:hypothetical protein